MLIAQILTCHSEQTNFYTHCSYWQARGQVPVQKPIKQIQKGKENLASGLCLKSYENIIKERHYGSEIWVIGHIVWSYLVHNWIHGLVPIDYESSFFLNFLDIIQNQWRALEWDRGFKIHKKCLSSWQYFEHRPYQNNLGWTSRENRASGRL